MRQYIGEFIIKEKFPGLNEIIKASKAHWAAYAKMKKKYTELVCKAAHELDQVGGKILLEIRWHEPRNGRRDPDNVACARKFLFDGLVEAKVILDDSKNYVYGASDAVVYDMEPKQFKVEVEVYEVIDNEIL